MNGIISFLIMGGSAIKQAGSAVVSRCRRRRRDQASDAQSVTSANADAVRANVSPVLPAMGTPPRRRVEESDVEAAGSTDDEAARLVSTRSMASMASHDEVAQPVSRIPLFFKNMFCQAAASIKTAYLWHIMGHAIGEMAKEDGAWFEDMTRNVFYLAGVDFLLGVVIATARRQRVHHTNAVLEANEYYAAVYTFLSYELEPVVLASQLKLFLLPMIPAALSLYDYDEGLRTFGLSMHIPTSALLPIKPQLMTGIGQVPQAMLRSRRIDCSVVPRVFFRVINMLQSPVVAAALLLNLFDFAITYDFPYRETTIQSVCGALGVLSLWRAWREVKFPYCLDLSDEKQYRAERYIAASVSGFLVSGFQAWNVFCFVRLLTNPTQEFNAMDPHSLDDFLIIAGSLVVGITGFVDGRALYKKCFDACVQSVPVVGFWQPQLPSETIKAQLAALADGSDSDQPFDPTTLARVLATRRQSSNRR